MSAPPRDPHLASPGDEELVVDRVVVAAPVSRQRQTISALSIVAAGVLTIFGWGVGAKAADASFSLSDSGSRFTIPNVQVPAEATAVAFGVVICLLGLWHLFRGFSRRAMRWVLAVVGVLFVVALLAWASTGLPQSIDVVGLLQQTVLQSTPLVLGAMSGIVCERSGVINVAIEGQMLVGAFAGALAASIASSAGLGILGAVLAGGLMGALLAVFAIEFTVNQVVLGVVLNLLALGLTGYGYDVLMQTNADKYNIGLGLGDLRIPGLADIPVIGEPLFDTNAIVYAMYVLIVVVDVVLFRTRWGLRTRAVGENPRAADTVGIHVRRTRYINVIIGGFIAGLAGASLTVGATLPFSKSPVGMTAGRGFIALAAVIFGKWSPRGAVAAALLFGFTTQLQTTLSTVNTPFTIPSAFLLMLPYVVTIVAVAGLVGRSQAPAADGEPYTKG